MEQISLTQGKVALVDKKDSLLIKSIKWHIHNTGCGIYARGHFDGKKVYMHRLLLSAPPGWQVDHINGNTLDNRRDNLRLVTPQQNSFNKKRITGRVPYRGVIYREDRKQYVARVTFHNKLYYAGYWDTAEQAALAYNDKAKELFGDNFHQNKVKNEKRIRNTM